MVRMVVARGVGSGDPDVLTRLELEVLNKIREHNGIDNPYSLVKMGFDSASAYVIVNNLIRKGFLERDRTGRIKPTPKALEANELVMVTREVRPTRVVGVRSIRTVDVPLRASKLGGGLIEATVACGSFNMTFPIGAGTPLWVRPSKLAPVTVTLRLTQGSWGVTRIQEFPSEGTGPQSYVTD